MDVGVLSSTAVSPAIRIPENGQLLVMSSSVDSTWLESACSNVVLLPYFIWRGGNLSSGPLHEISLKGEA